MGLAPLEIGHENLVILLPGHEDWTLAQPQKLDVRRLGHLSTPRPTPSSGPTPGEKTFSTQPVWGFGPEPNPNSIGVRAETQPSNQPCQLADLLDSDRSIRLVLCSFETSARRPVEAMPLGYALQMSGFPGLFFCKARADMNHSCYVTHYHVFELKS